MAKEKEKTFENMYLVLESGGLIEIGYEVDGVNFDDAFEEMNQCIEIGRVWYVGNYPDWKANYMGEELSEINCSKVIGWR